MPAYYEVFNAHTGATLDFTTNLPLAKAMALAPRHGGCYDYFPAELNGEGRPIRFTSSADHAAYEQHKRRQAS